jgi:hypothetical protein
MKTTSCFGVWRRRGVRLTDSIGRTTGACVAKLRAILFETDICCRFVWFEGFDETFHDAIGSQTKLQQHQRNRARCKQVPAKWAAV